MDSNKQRVGPVSPFFVIENVPRSLAFYVDLLGFDLRLSLPEDDPFFAIVGREEAQLLLKVVEPGVTGRPNPDLHRFSPWDAFVCVEDPDALAAEFHARAVPFHDPLGNREDGLRGFEVRDPDGFVLYFGRPQGAQD